MENNTGSSALIIGIIILAGIYYFAIYSPDKDQPYEVPNYNKPILNYSNVANQSINESKPFESETVLMASWNIGPYTKTKASDNKLIDAYLEKIKEYDIMFLQGIRDSSGEAFDKLCYNLQEYNCHLTSGSGKEYTERTGIIYKKGIKLDSIKDYEPDAEQRWNRPPIQTTFQINQEEINTYNIHADKNNVKEELDHLSDIITLQEKNIILGTLYADCLHYARSVYQQFELWTWAIQDYQDTTTGIEHCSYDRILFNYRLKENYLNSGINKDIDKTLSDHYIVWIELKV